MRRYIKSFESRASRRAALVKCLMVRGRHLSRGLAIGLVLSSALTTANVTRLSAQEADSRALERETPTVRAIRRCTAAVVNIHGQKTIRETAASMAGASDVGKQVNGMGTGIVIDPRGYVITNYHVVEDVDQIQITLDDGTNTTAELVDAAIRSDLALLKVNTTKELPTIPRGTSSDLMVGEPVIAIGNAFGYVHTATEGIVSALHRDVPVNDTQEYRDLIQTSAGINPGNSGGPLLNIHGEVIGVNVAVRLNSQQIAFAIPIDQAIDIVSEMIRNHNEERLGLGLTATAPAEDGEGVLVKQVSATGIAAKQGIKAGDQIVSVNGVAVSNSLDLGLAMIELDGGEEAKLELKRSSEVMQVTLQTESVGGDLSQNVMTLAWNAIGVKLQPVSRTTMHRINSRAKKSYRGGLYVVEVRKGSPAEGQGIKQGDVLVGLHGFYTASMGELQGILSKAVGSEASQGEFRIIRSNQEMYGYMRLAEVPHVRRR